jgi:hypothetical protein
MYAVNYEVVKHIKQKPKSEFIVVIKVMKDPTEKWMLRLFQITPLCYF